MYFTQEDYRKIERWLSTRTAKDTSFERVKTLKKADLIPIVQDFSNKTVTASDVAWFLELFAGNWINVSHMFNKCCITLNEAIALIPKDNRKLGIVITFLNKERQWVTYQFKSNNIENWDNTNYWIDNAIYIPDEQLDSAIKDYLGSLDLTEEVNQKLTESVNEYLKTEIIRALIIDNINNYLDSSLEEKLSEEKLRQIVDEYLDTLDVNTIINDKSEIIINNYLEDKGEEITDLVSQYINEHLNEDVLNDIVTNIISSNLNDILNNYFTSDEGKDAIREAVEPQLEEITGQFFEQVVNYVQDNERVIANALVRHEQAINDLQN